METSFLRVLILSVVIHYEYMALFFPSKYLNMYYCYEDLYSK